MKDRDADLETEPGAFSVPSDACSPGVLGDREDHFASLARFGWVPRMALFVICLGALSYCGGWVAHQLGFPVWPRHLRMVEGVMFAAALAYVVLMALPFMPGIEIGLGLMVMLGGQGAFFVYVCTLAALSISFAVGRVVPLSAVGRFLGWFCLHRAQDLVCRLEPLTPEQRIELLRGNLPPRIAPLLLKHRGLVIAVALNIPGNALIGGGGGIGLIAGVTRLVSFPRYLFTVGFAVAPVPLIFLLKGPP
jgi:hypothetical protein